MYVAAEKFPELCMHDYPALHQHDGPALVRVGVRLIDHPDDFRDSNLPITRYEISARLYVREHQNGPSASLNQLTFNDLGVSISCPRHAKAPAYFDRLFDINECHDIQIEFVAFVRDPVRDAPNRVDIDGNISAPDVTALATEEQPVSAINGTATTILANDTPEEIVGTLCTTLEAIRTSDGESIELPVDTSEANLKIVRSAALSIEWQRQPDDELIFQFQVNIMPKGGWPFSSRRPFFVLYRWDSGVRRWDPFYRSEVLTEPSIAPKSKGCMFFRLVLLKTRDVLGINDTMTNNKNLRINENLDLRIEFFHYKPGEPHLLAGHYTSLSKLRQTEEGTRLSCLLNVFPKGELVGNVMLQNKKITASRYYFCIQANFGGPVVGNFVYITMTVTDLIYAPGVKIPRDSRLFFTICWYNDQGSWVEVHTSELFPRHMPQNSTHLFRIVRLTEQRLGARNNSPVCIKFCRGRPPKLLLPFASVTTTVPKLIETQLDTHLPLIRITPTYRPRAIPASLDQIGYIRVEQAVRLQSQTHLKLHAVLPNIADLKK